MCAADTLHGLPAKWGIKTKVSKREPANLKCLSDLTAMEEPQIRAGSNSRTNVDLAVFKKPHKNSLIYIFSFGFIEAVYAEFNMEQRGFTVQIKQVIKG